MTESDDSSRIIKLERVDLDFRSRPELAERLERFLSEHRAELGFEGELDLITAWLDRVWPDGAPGEAIITKLAPKEGKQNWQLRPAWSETNAADAKSIAAGSQIPAFGIFYRDGKLVVLWFEPVLHRPPGAFDFRLQGCFSRSSFRGGVTAEDAQRLLALPHYAPSAENRLRKGNTADNGEEMRKLYKRHANVIGATCNRTGRRDFYQSTEFDPSFDLVVVDEVSKATPPELLMPLLLGRRSVLVGDHRQLPPVFRGESFEEAVANEELKAEMLENFGKMVSASLFEELFISAPDALRETLCEQYRMHPHIMQAVNHFYPDKHGKGILRAGGGEQELHRKKQHGLSVRGTSERPLLTSEHRVLCRSCEPVVHRRTRISLCRFGKSAPSRSSETQE